MAQTKLKIEDNRQSASMEKCSVDECGQPAAVFCVNDNAYFCESCDKYYHENTDNPSSRFMAEHKRVKHSNKPIQFGRCELHPDRGNEYFCYCCEKSYCSQCLLDGVTSGDNRKHKLINIQKAYQDATKGALEEDVALQGKKELIESYLDSVKQKMLRIKDNASSIQKEITELLEKTLADMNKIVKVKASQLQSDRQELVRQY